MMEHRYVIWLLTFVGLLTFQATANSDDLGAQDEHDSPVVANVPADLETLQSRLASQEEQLKQLRSLIEQHAKADQHFGLQPAKDTKGCDGEMIDRVRLAAELTSEPDCDSSQAGSGFRTLNFFADYDRGFLIRAFDKKQNAFELKVNAWTQFRHHGFDRDEESWVDQSGVVRAIENRNAFDIERGRLALSGTAFDPRLTYFLQLDGDTDGEHSVDFFDYWWGWQLTDNFQLQFGKRKVTASRQWLLGARSTRFSERPMANDFFRPDRTVGVFGVGSIGDTVNYEVMVGNSYNSANIVNADIDKHFTYAATTYVDPLGDYGNELIDFEYSSKPLVRVGHSFVFSPQASDANSRPLAEADFLRLSDGTRITQFGALGPFATVSNYDIYFYGIDLAAKWSGWSANAEIFFRWIEDIDANLPLNVGETFQDGFYVEGGRFLIPKKLDANVRYSQVNGQFGSGSELAAGVNWFPQGNTHLKLSFDVTALDSSPLQNTTSDILVGDDGVLFRSQFQADF